MFKPLSKESKHPASHCASCWPEGLQWRWACCLDTLSDCLNSLSSSAITVQGITIADPNLPDCPLMYVNEAFCRMTGYDQDEILGRNCRFLQGPETDKASLARIKVAMQQVPSPCTLGPHMSIHLSASSQQL